MDELLKELNRKLSRLERQRDELLKEHLGNEASYTYWGGHKLGYIKGKIYQLEWIIEELSNKDQS